MSNLSTFINTSTENLIMVRSFPLKHLLVWSCEANMLCYTNSSLFRVAHFRVQASHLSSTKPFPGPLLNTFQMCHHKHSSMRLYGKCIYRLSKSTLKMFFASILSISCYINSNRHPIPYTYGQEREREIKFIGLFEDRGHWGPYSPYKHFNYNLYIGIIIFPHIDNPQSTDYN